ncbi:hypothetical protein B0H14DRAFT_2567906 [Mycena olivaceomarginata]|nr:hypothetical protein B0H14DRAFT_2567906 [Mycena olivaceomarginata]
MNFSQSGKMHGLMPTNLRSSGPGEEQAGRRAAGARGGSERDGVEAALKVDSRSAMYPFRTPHASHGCHSLRDTLATGGGAAGSDGSHTRGVAGGSSGESDVALPLPHAGKGGYSVAGDSTCGSLSGTSASPNLFTGVGSVSQQDCLNKTPRVTVLVAVVLRERLKLGLIFKVALARHTCIGVLLLRKLTILRAVMGNCSEQGEKLGRFDSFDQGLWPSAFSGDNQRGRFQLQHYLIAISADARSLRDLAQQTLELRGQYHCAIAALKHLRDVHIQIACFNLWDFRKVPVIMVAAMRCPDNPLFAHIFYEVLVWQVDQIFNLNPIILLKGPPALFLRILNVDLVSL